MANYLDQAGLQEYTTKLTAKNKEIFATKSEVGAPLVASSVAEMTDTDRIYVYVGSETGYTSGNWYYYDGSAWESGGVYNSTALVTDPTLTIAGEAGDAKATGDRLTPLETAMPDKANIDGYYESMSVGSAEQLLSSTYVSDSVPYKFRTSGGSADVGDREFDEIVGGSLVVNQLCEQYPTTTDGGVTATNDGTGILTFSGTSTAGGNFIFMSNLDGYANHKYLINLGDLTADGPVTIYLRDTTNLENIIAGRIDVVQQKYAIGACLVNCKLRYYMNFGSAGRTISGTLAPMVIDLTAMFGTTIADYVYNLEQATTGAGVAWVQRYIGTGYHPYSANTLTHISGLSKHEMTGFQQWDEEWDNGAISNSTGQNTTGTNVRSKNYIPVLPNTTYYLKAPNTMSLFSYDESQAYNEKLSISSSGTFTTPSNCHYLRFIVTTGYGTVYKNDICINIHWDGERDGEYEPYVKHTYALDSSLTLRGIPKLDADNKLYFDGDVYASDGTVERRYKELVFDGSNDESWGLQSINDHGIANFTLTVTDQWITGNRATGDKSRCNLFSPQDSLIANTTTEGYYFASSSSLYIRIDSSKASTVAEFRTWLASNNVDIVYELATPTIESAEPFTSPQIVDDFGTEEYVSNTIVPVGHNTKYTANLKAKLEMSPNSPDGDGDYIVRQTNGMNVYVPLEKVKELPDAPSEDGTYLLKATVTNGTAVLSWEVQS